MTPPNSERGTALLTVLLLVAVMASVAATALDRLGMATRLAFNAAEASQSRAWLGMAERLAATRIEDLLAADPSQTTLKGGWLGTERSIALPDGATLRASLGDGGNCFNLNSVVQPAAPGIFARREMGLEQFSRLMILLGVGAGEAQAIAAAAADYVDSDALAASSGGETGAPNRLMLDESELRAIPGMTDRRYRLLRPWICALPTSDLSPINVNTLAPEQSLLLAMLGGEMLGPAAARNALARRPADGFGSVVNFWNSPALRGATVPPEASSQVRVRSAFFTLSAAVDRASNSIARRALLDARTTPVRLVRRSGAS
jgi:general secretion pathway protein K